MEQQPKECFDPSEAVIMVSFLLPYTLERNQKTGVLSIQKSFVKNPVMMYASLLDLCEKKKYNFHWVGLVITLEDVSDYEKIQLTKEFNKLQQYPIFMTSTEIEPFLIYYEGILRPLFHNFKDIKNIG